MTEPKQQIADLENEGVQYSAVKINKPREMVFTDEFISKVITKVRVQSIHLYTEDGKSPYATLEYYDTKDTEEEKELVILIGEGPTMGHSLRMILDSLAELLGMDPDEI